MPDLDFTDLNNEDLLIVKEIYDHYILQSTATYYTEPVTIEELSKFIPVAHEKYKSFLVKLNDEVIGFSYLSAYKNRQAYDRTAEVSLYLKPEFTGKGYGKIMLRQIEQVAQNKGIKVLIGIISGDNVNSIRLFEKCGYDKCAHFRQIGEKFGKVLDVVCFQKNF